MPKYHVSNDPDTAMWMQTIGKRMRVAREIRGYSQRRLAEVSGVHKGTIAKIENGENPSLSILFSIIRTLDIKPGAIMDTIDQMGGADRVRATIHCGKYIKP